MIDKLPYRLSEGVTATQDGLKFESLTYAHKLANFIDVPLRVKNDTGYDADIFIAWPYAAERLRYREGEPWCTNSALNNLIIMQSKHSPDDHGEIALYHLAAILCDDADAFRVLHWCIHNLGGER